MRLQESSSVQDKMKLTNEDLIQKLKERSLNNEIGLNNIDKGFEDPLSPLDKNPSKIDPNVFKRPEALSGL